jgi:hypothetical protein
MIWVLLLFPMFTIFSEGVGDWGSLGLGGMYLGGNGPGFVFEPIIVPELPKLLLLSTGRLLLVPVLLFKLILLLLLKLGTGFTMRGTSEMSLLLSDSLFRDSYIFIEF